MPTRGESQEQIQNLRHSLEDIKIRKGVLGYILRASTSAAVDIKDPSKIIDYAALSATVLESGEDISNIFNLGEIKTILLEGVDTKILSLVIGDHRLSIFMEKNVDHNTIYKDLNLT
jgi:predicted regulator of Ras-like GTPase activity (Roadblock/LC7/MglB family)